MTVIDPLIASDVARLRALLALAESDPALYTSVRPRVIRTNPPGKAPPTTIPHTWKMVWQYLGPNSTKASNVLWGFAPTFDGSTTILATICTAMNIAYTNTDSLIHQLTPEWYLENVVAYDNSGSTNSSLINTHSHGLLSPTGSPLTPQAAAVVSWSTGEKYKGGKPRTYMPGMNTQNLSAAGSNNWGSTFQAALKAAAAAFLRELLAALVSAVAGAQVGTLHRAKNGAWLTPPTFAAYLSDSTAGSTKFVNVHERVDTQRRRLGKEIPGT